MTSDVPLLPCPFCGSTEVEVEVERHSYPGGVAFVWCYGCGAEGGKEDTRAEAVARWNARAG